VIIYSAAKAMSILNSINMPPLRIFPEYNEIDKVLLTEYFKSNQLNRTLFDTYCSVVKDSELNDAERYQASTAIKKNLKLNQINNPAFNIIQQSVEK